MKRLQMVGLSGSGKTTFLAALNWSTRHPSEDARLVADGQADDTQYINERTHEWAACEPVEKTPAGVHRLVELWLRETATGEKVTLRCPDLSGEMYQDHWKTRQWPQERDEEVSASDGLLVFVSTKERYLPTTLVEEAELVAAVGGAPGAEVPHLEAWAPEHSCQQVQLVELLQFIRNRRGLLASPIRTCVVVSAWDLEHGSGSTPDEWLRREAPLLWQALQCNAEVMPSRVFGVSAQGGAYPTEAERLRNIDEPVERIMVVGTEHGQAAQNHDITRPLAWLLRKEP